MNKEQALAWLEKAVTILERVGKYGPNEGMRGQGACAFCDMGEAGYSFRGDGFHDDACAVKDAQIFVRECRQKASEGE